VLVKVGDSREVLYVAASRARLRSMLYAVTDDEAAEIPCPRSIDGQQVLKGVIAREMGSPSAIEAIRRVQRQPPTTQGAVSRLPPAFM
jgi:hypothetical protein